MTDFLALADTVAAHALANYNTKDARFDVIVECYDLADIANELRYANVTDEAGAIAWADEAAGLQHEVELNQALDGPESCIGSSQYRPDLFGRETYTDSCVGYPHYTLTPEEAAYLLAQEQANGTVFSDPAGDPDRYEGNAR
jgi:hypothetical protein